MLHVYPMIDFFTSIKTLYPSAAAPPPFHIVESIVANQSNHLLHFPQFEGSHKKVFQLLASCCFHMFGRRQKTRQVGTKASMGVWSDACWNYWSPLWLHKELGFWDQVPNMLVF